MILALFKRNNPKNKWQLITAIQSLSLKEAETYKQEVIKKAKQSGYDNIEVVIQKYDSIYDVPETLKEATSEKILLN